MANFYGHDSSTMLKMRQKTPDALPGMFRGTNYITGAELAAEKIREHEIALEELRQRGQLNVSKLQNVGQFDVANINREAGNEQQQLRNIGILNVAEMEQKGLAERQKNENLNKLDLQNIQGKQKYDIAKLQNVPEMAKLKYIQEQEPFRQYSTLQELENKAAEVGRLNQYPLDMGYREYQKRLYNPEMASTEDSIRKKLSSGIDPTKINFTDAETSFLRENMPGITPERSVQINDTVTYNNDTGTYTNAPTINTKSPIRNRSDYLQNQINQSKGPAMTELYGNYTNWLKENTPKQRRLQPLSTY